MQTSGPGAWTASKGRFGAFAVGPSSAKFGLRSGKCVNNSMSAIPQKPADPEANAVALATVAYSDAGDAKPISINR
ncbi:hypothetical protein PUN4_510052 [Paraburkholderia unamae]|nr:hypothetical protein PUN4_510052 [Paraburkholderia unamae]